MLLNLQAYKTIKTFLTNTYNTYLHIKTPSNNDGNEDKFSSYSTWIRAVVLISFLQFS